MAKKAELLAEAELLGLDVNENTSKGDLEAALREAGSDLVPAEPAAPKPAEKAEKVKTYRIKTPVAGYNGKSNGVSFADGEGTTTNEWFAQRCIDAGYEVTEA